MRDISALHLGFAGCRTSLQKARRQFHLDPNDAAGTLDALGALLMTASLDCLPVKYEADPQTIIEQALAWPLIPSRTQLRTLERLMGFLAEPPPSRDHAPGKSYDHPMLPTEMRAWNSQEPPSCLGMVILLAAYARLTSAPFLIGSVQRMSAEPATLGLERLLSDAHRWAAARLPNGFRSDGLPKKLQGIIEDARAATTLMTTRRQFHGALVIRLADRRWASLDPYMHNLSFFEPKNRPIDKVFGHLNLHPGATANVQGLGYWQRLPELEHQLREVYGIIEYLLGLPRDMPLIELSHRLHYLAQVRAGIAMTSAEDMLLHACTISPEWQLPSRQGASTLLTSMPSYRLQHEMRERVLMVLLNVWAEWAFKAANQTRSEQLHHAMALSSPARTLAAWTVINLRHRGGARLLAADLLEYSGNEVVLYNALLDQQRGRTTRAEDDTIRRQVAQIRQAPNRLMHPLLLEVLG